MEGKGRNRIGRAGSGKYWTGLKLTRTLSIDLDRVLYYNVVYRKGSDGTGQDWRGSEWTGAEGYGTGKPYLLI